MAQSTFILSPEMRLVAGDPFTPNTKDKMGNPKVVQNGPNKGQPTQDFPVICAIAKNDPLAVPFLMDIMKVGAAAKPALFPRGVTAPPAGFAPQYANQVAMLFGCTHPNYFGKIQDGDGWDGDGKPNANKEGYPGHWIVNMKQPSAPKVYKAGEYHDSQRIDIDKTKHGFLKRGYRVRVNIGVQDNNDDSRPGLYLNPNMVEITRPDTEITSGPDAGAVFGGASVAGGLVGTGKDGQTIETLRAAGWSDDQMVSAGYAVRSTPPPAPAPAPAPANPPPPPVPAGLTPTGKDGQTIEALRAAGWTDEQMIAGGYATRPAPAVPPVPPSSVSPPPPPPAPTPGASTPGGTAAGAAAPPPPATPSPSNPPPPPYNGYMGGGTTAPPPPAPGRQMTAAAQGITYDQYKATGWTDEMLIQHGMMTA